MTENLENSVYTFNHEPTAEEIADLPEGASVMVYDPSLVYNPQ
jgi:hypothetical protein